MPLNPNQTLELLNSLNHNPNKKLGQNFLIDGNIVRKSIDLAELTRDSIVVEVGPGLGTLSEALLKEGLSLYAVEKDPTLYTHLKNTIAKVHSKFDLVEADCLKKPLGNLNSNAHKEFKIVANLPYAVSTPWLEIVLFTAFPKCMVLMLQKEAADRYCAQPKTKAFGAISIFLQSAYTVRSTHNVSANCFFPKPKIDSTLICLDLKDDPICFSREARAFIRRIFTQRRKQIQSLCKKDSYEGALEWLAFLKDQSFSENIRAEEITLSSWQKLGYKLHHEN